MSESTATQTENQINSPESEETKERCQYRATATSPLCGYPLIYHPRGEGTHAFTPTKAEPVKQSPAFLFRDNEDEAAFMVWSSRNPDEESVFLCASCVVTPQDREFPLYADDLESLRNLEPILCELCNKELAAAIKQVSAPHCLRCVNDDPEICRVKEYDADSWCHCPCHIKQADREGWQTRQPDECPECKMDVRFHAEGCSGSHFKQEESRCQYGADTPVPCAYTRPEHKIGRAGHPFVAPDRDHRSVEVNQPDPNVCQHPYGHDICGLTLDSHAFTTHRFVAPIQAASEPPTTDAFGNRLVASGPCESLAEFEIVDEGERRPDMGVTHSCSQHLGALIGSSVPTPPIGPWHVVAIDEPTVQCCYIRDSNLAAKVGYETRLHFGAGQAASELVQSSGDGPATIFAEQPVESAPIHTRLTANFDPEMLAGMNRDLSHIERLVQLAGGGDMFISSEAVGKLVAEVRSYRSTAAETAFDIETEMETAESANRALKTCPYCGDDLDGYCNSCHSIVKVVHGSDGARVIHATEARAARSPQAPTDEFVEKWSHGCNAVCSNIDLWVSRCPHCGMPSASQPPIAASSELLRDVHTLLKELDHPTVEMREAGGECLVRLIDTIRAGEKAGPPIEYADYVFNQMLKAAPSQRPRRFSEAEGYDCTGSIVDLLCRIQKQPPITEIDPVKGKVS